MRTSFPVAQAPDLLRHFLPSVTLIAGGVTNAAARAVALLDRHLAFLHPDAVLQLQRLVRRQVVLEVVAEAAVVALAAARSPSGCPGG